MRTKTMLGLTYDTPPDKIEAFCEGVRELIRENPHTRKTGYYFLKILAPLILIVAMSWVVFWIDPTEAGTQISVAVTGIAGPGGGTPEKPEGLVDFACAREGQPTRHARIEFGALGRSVVRARSVDQALGMVMEALTA